MDLVKTYTEEGKVKEEKERKNIDKVNDIVKCVFIFVLNSNNEIFLSKIPEKSQLYAGKYGISCAGIMRSSEDIIKAALRTVRKELGVSPKLNMLGTDFYDFEGVKRFITAFYCLSDEIYPNREDVPEGEFLTKERVEEMMSNKEIFSPTFVALWEKYRYIIE